MACDDAAAFTYILRTFFFFFKKQKKELEWETYVAQQLVAYERWK